jgi:hypothetical protein
VTGPPIGSSTSHEQTAREAKPFHQHTDPPHPIGLLRPRRERRRRYRAAAKQDDEIAPSYT